MHFIEHWCGFSYDNSVEAWRAASHQVKMWTVGDRTLKLGQQKAGEVKRSATDLCQVANVHSRMTGQEWEVGGGADCHMLRRLPCMDSFADCLTCVSTVRGVWQDGDFIWVARGFCQLSSSQSHEVEGLLMQRENPFLGFSARTLTGREGQWREGEEEKEHSHSSKAIYHWQSVCCGAALSKHFLRIISAG